MRYIAKRPPKSGATRFPAYLLICLALYGLTLPSSSDAHKGITGIFDFEMCGTYAQIIGAPHNISLGRDGF